MSEDALMQAMEAPSAPTVPVVAKQIAEKIAPKADRSERQAERANQAMLDKAAPRLSREERLAAESEGMSADEILAREAADKRRGGEDRDDDAEDFERNADAYDRAKRDPDAKKDEDDDPMFRDPAATDAANPYGLPEETEFTDKNGKTYKLPRELVEGALRQADYTRGKQEIAELKRSTVAERAMLAIQTKITQELAPAIAQVHNLRNSADQDRQRLPDPETDPLGYIKLDKLIRDREAAASSLEQAIAEKRTEYATQQQSVQAELLHSGVEWLKRTTKGNWNQNVQTQVGQYAVGQGFTPEELTANFDPRFVLMAYKAMQYDRRGQERSIPADKRRESKPVPVIKHSAPSPRGKDPQIAEYRQKASRSGNINDVGNAIAALMDRSRRR